MSLTLPSRLRGVRLSADEWCELADKFHSQLDGDQHVMIPQSIVINGKTASCHVLVQGHHFYRHAKGSPFQKLIGAYDMDFEKTGGWLEDCAIDPRPDVDRRNLEALSAANNDPKKALKAYPGLFRRSLEEDNRMCLCSFMAAEYDDLPDTVKTEVKAFADVNIAWLTRMLTAVRFLVEMVRQKLAPSSLP